MGIIQFPNYSNNRKPNLLTHAGKFFFFVMSILLLRVVYTGIVKRQSHIDIITFKLISGGN